MATKPIKVDVLAAEMQGINRHLVRLEGLFYAAVAAAAATLSYLTITTWNISIDVARIDTSVGTATSEIGELRKSVAEMNGILLRIDGKLASNSLEAPYWAVKVGTSKDIVSLGEYAAAWKGQVGQFALIPADQDARVFLENFKASEK